MARLKVDENLPQAVVRLLRDAGHDAIGVREQGLGGKSDDIVAEACRNEGRTVLTLDRRFGDPRRHPTHGTAGIIVLRPTSQAQEVVLELVRRLAHVLRRESPADSLWVMDSGRIRIRPG